MRKGAADSEYKSPHILRPHSADFGCEGHPGVFKMKYYSIQLTFYICIVIVISSISLNCLFKPKDNNRLTEVDRIFLEHLELNSNDSPTKHIDIALIREFTAYISMLNIDYTDEQLIENNWNDLIPFGMDYPNFIIIDSSKIQDLHGKYRYICESTSDGFLLHVIDGLGKIDSYSYTNDLYEIWNISRFNTKLMFIIRCLHITSQTNFQDICDIYHNGIDAMKYNSDNLTQEYYVLKFEAEELLESHHFNCSGSIISWDMDANGIPSRFAVDVNLDSIISSDLLAGFDENIYSERLDEAIQ